MLDNTELIETLEETKSKATEVTEKLKLAAITAVDIDKLRDGCVSEFRIGSRNLTNGAHKKSELLQSYLGPLGYTL